MSAIISRKDLLQSRGGQRRGQSRERNRRERARATERTDATGRDNSFAKRVWESDGGGWGADSGAGPRGAAEGSRKAKTARDEEAAANQVIAERRMKRDAA